MIAVDTNILVSAHRHPAVDHEIARDVLERLVSQPGAWGLPWPVAHEFVCVATTLPGWGVSLDDALHAIGRLLQAPGCVPLGEGRTHWHRVSDLARKGRTPGARFYDARIAAICLDHGVRELWSADRDFGRFPELRVVNPLVRGDVSA